MTIRDKTIYYLEYILGSLFAAGSTLTLKETIIIEIIVAVMTAVVVVPIVHFIKRFLNKKWP